MVGSSPSRIPLGFPQRLALLGLVLLPTCSVANHLRGLGESQERVMASTMLEGMRNRASQQHIVYDDLGRFSSVEELESMYGPMPIEAHRGMRGRLSATIVEQVVTDSTYTITAILDEAPWMRATVSTTLQGTEVTTSVDWIESVVGRRWTIILITLFLGLAAAILARRAWDRVDWVPSGTTIAVLVLAAMWLVTLSYAPIIPQFDRVGPALDDSVWTPFVGL